jgi:hypothetical protein
VKVIGLNRSFERDPTFFSPLLFDELLTPFFELANEDTFAAPWTSGEMRDNQVDTVFISLILVAIHVLFIHDYRQQCKS